LLRQREFGVVQRIALFLYNRNCSSSMASTPKYKVANYKDDDAAAEVLRLTDGHGAEAIIDMDLSTTAALLPSGCVVNHGIIVSCGSHVFDFQLIGFSALVQISES
jgi:NADPH:quinone reductase-like Zn-dependent oxidoreductase